MPEREQTRLRERDRAGEDMHPYEVFFAAFGDRRRLAEEGQIVIKGKDLPWQQSRQGRSKYFLHLRAEDRAMQDWMLFQKDIMTESGAHTHQGGLVIYVTRGAGYSVFDGVKYDWKPGDLLILPVKPGGVEHQHFNYDDEQSSQWVAFIFVPFLFQTGSMLAQVKEQSNWREIAGQDEEAMLDDPIAEVTRMIGDRAKTRE
jgi:hypothetical protein